MFCCQGSERGKRPQEEGGERCERLHCGKGLAGVEVVLLALKPYPLVNACCGDVFAQEVGGDVVVGEIRVEGSPGVWDGGEAEPECEAEGYCPLQAFDVARLRKVRV